MLLAGHLNTWKPEEVFTAVKDGGGSVQEAGELLRDTCSLLLALLGAVWKNRKGMGEKVSEGVDLNAGERTSN